MAYAYALAVAGAVRVVRVDLHVGATIESVQPPEKALQGISL